MKKIDIPSGVKTIPIECFHRCFELSDITLHDGLEKIDFLAFDSCHSVKEIRIPSTVTDICINAFSNCISLEHLIISKELYCKIKPDFDKIFTYCYNLKNIETY